MKDFLMPSSGMAFGVREVNSYQILTLKAAATYQARLLREGPTSRLARWAGISTVVTLTPNARRVQAETLRVVALKDPEPPVFLPSPRQGDRVVAFEQSPGYLKAFVNSSFNGQQVVFSEVDFPGWQLIIDGIPSAHEQFEDTFLCAKVAKGPHELIFKFASESFRIGVRISALTALGLIAYSFLFRYRTGEGVT